MFTIRNRRDHYDDSPVLHPIIKYRRATLVTQKTSRSSSYCLYLLVFLLNLPDMNHSCISYNVMQALFFIIKRDNKIENA